MNFSGEKLKVGLGLPRGGYGGAALAVITEMDRVYEPRLKVLVVMAC